MKKGKVLIIDDNRSVSSALEILLHTEFATITSLNNPKKITSLRDLDSYDVVLLDMNFSASVMTGNEGLFWLKEIKKLVPDLIVIAMTAFGGVDLAVKALKEGATDFILKPWSNEKLLATLKSARLLSKSKREIEAQKSKVSGLKQFINQEQTPIIGDSVAMKSLLDLTRKVAKAGANVLVTGENGTGKELIARELHRMSDRSQEVLINVDLGSIAETLFESELFGHDKGAFTDAKQDRMGKFEAANGGTLFLDEIGNLSLPSQAKLLSAFQRRTITRVGSNKEIPVDIQLICATNGNLEQMVTDGKFREDLLYRINTIHIEVPSLRERGRDVILLAKYFLDKYGSKYARNGLRIDRLAESKLMDYHWPGNVRELQHVLERAVILSEGNVLQPNDFLISPKTSLSYEDGPETLIEMERHMIEKSLKKHKGNYTAAANQLGISRQTLYNKLKKMDQ